MTWLLNNKEFKDPSIKHIGFIYRITEIHTGRIYLGKKNLWRKKVLPKNSKRSRKEIIQVPSDWQDYYGSNKELQLRVLEYGKDNYKREILEFATTKGELSYKEIKWQLAEDVLNDDKYFNNFVSCRIHRKHLPRKG